MKSSYRILVFNNSHSEYNLLETLSHNKKFCIFTIGDIKPVYTSNIFHKKIDYTDVKKIKTLIKQNKIDYLIPCANDLSMYSIVQVDRKKYFDNLGVIKIIHDKKKYRKFESRYFKNTIKFSLLNNVKTLNKLKMPILAKPLTGSGGKGIKKINNNSEITEILKSKHNNYFFEEFVKGSNHGIFTLIQNKKIIFTFYDTEQRFINEFTVSSTNTLNPFSNSQQRQFLRKVNKIISLLKLKNGILHFQVKFYQEQIKIIEVTRRIPGDQYLKFVEIATGYPVIENIINIYLGIKPKSLASKRYYVLRKVVMADKNGCIKKIIINNQIRRYMIWRYDVKNSGNHVKDYLNERIAILIFKFKTKKELAHSTKFIDQLVNVSMK